MPYGIPLMVTLSSMIRAKWMYEGSRNLNEMIQALDYNKEFLK